jgi:hypothetical protein
MANYTLSQAIDLFNQDQVRTQTMYEIRFDTGIPEITARLERMQVYGQSFTLPDRTVNFEDLQYRAYKIPVPTTIDMGQDHSITVYADVRGDLRRAMLDWQAACLNPAIDQGSYFEANRRPTKLGPGEGGVPTITIDLLAPNYQDVVETTVIFGSRVTKVGGLELSNTAGSISTFSVDLKSVYWQQQGGRAPKNSDANRANPLGAASGAEEPNRATNDTIISG